MNQFKDGLDVRMQLLPDDGSEHSKLSQEEFSPFGLARFRNLNYLRNNLIDVFRGPCSEALEYNHDCLDYLLVEVGQSMIVKHSGQIDYGECWIVFIKGATFKFNPLDDVGSVYTARLLLITLTQKPTSLVIVFVWKLW